MGKFSTVANVAISAVLDYDTPKIVHIKNKTVGLLNRLVQLAIILYIIVWGIILQKGYQMTGPVTGTVTTKLKGAAFYDGSHGDYSEGCNDDINRTFDVGDYVIPPQEPSSFFVMTNLWKTCNQTQGVCAESQSVVDSKCNLTYPTDNTDCLDANHQSFTFEGGNGPTTGNCVPVADGTGQCEIRAWCDVENENENISAAGPKIDASEFTVLVKASIEFPTVLKGVRKRNIKDTSSPLFLKKCRFNASIEEDLYCPIFSLRQIVEMIESTKKVPWKQEFKNLSTRGAVVGLEIYWDCDHLERNLDHCHPKYIAKRYDDPAAKISQGYNFRFARYYEENGVLKRDFTKAYGILFKIELHGTGGKFDFFTLILKIGSMIALLGIAAVVSDILVLYVVKKRLFYRENKYLNVNDAHSDYEVVDHKDAAEVS